MILQILTLFGAIGLFLYGLNLLSNGILKLTGDKVKQFLPWMRKNPVTSIISGAGMTAVAESSSAATVMIVSFVNAGALTLAQAILMITGANIGASITSWLIAIFGFGLGITSYAYPFIALGFVLMMMKGQKRKTFGEIVLGFALIFLGLNYMITQFPAVAEMPAFKSTVDGLAGSGYLSVLLFMAFGCVLAFALQSTGAVVFTMVLTCSGWIGFDMAVAMVVGENIGTTITANLAASEANVQAKRAALVHTLFNIFGAVVTFALFHPFLRLIGLCISLTGLPDPYLCDTCGNHTQIISGVFGLALFHTLFNLFNTCLLAWFTGPVEKLVTVLVKVPEGAQESDSRLKYISARNFSSPSISIVQAGKEIAHFGQELEGWFGFVRKAVNEQNPDKFEDYRMKLVQMEEFSDKLEYQIAEFLNGVTMESLSEEEASQIKVLYRIIGELESLGDSGENVSRILERERVHNRKFDEKAISNINLMIDKVEKAFEVMVYNLKLSVSGAVTDISNAYQAEDDINETRNRLREEGIGQIEMQTGNYQSLNYFLDIIAELEAMGDFMINVSQALLKKS
ncbi:MAG: Na/Pi cotransporter family protein [Candidatus Cryptobacteroides sp.]